MKVWRPQLNPVIGLVTFGIYTIVFFMFGAILKSSSDSVKSFDVRYDKIEDCKIKSEDGNDCTIPLTINEKIPKPVYFYYQLENFY